MRRLQTEEELAAAVARLVEIEPRFAAIVSRHGLPRLRRVEPGLSSLLRIVTEQLISLKAAEAIWRRVETRFPVMAPEILLAVTAEELKSLGLSGAKARSYHAAARAFLGQDGSQFEGLSGEQILGRLTAISGVGPWTANVYLMMALQAADAWPAADLALQLAALDLLALSRRPTSREMERLGHGWRPYRTAAALLLWSHYRGMRQMSQA